MTATYYACACRPRHEEAVSEDLIALGAWVWLPWLIRPQNVKGTVYASRRPRWPGWIFARLDGSQLFDARNIKHLHRHKLPLHAAEVHNRGGLLDMREQIERDNERTRREIEMGNRKTDFAEGDRLELIDGPFKDRLASFASVIEKSGVTGYHLSVQIEGMTLPVQVNPADVRKLG